MCVRASVTEYDHSGVLDQMLHCYVDYMYYRSTVYKRTVIYVEYCLNFFTVRSTQYSGLILGVYVRHAYWSTQYSVSDVGKICIYVVASVRASVTEYDHSGVLHYLRIVLNCTNSNYGAWPGLSTESKQ